jgi:hypothetical protein
MHPINNKTVIYLSKAGSQILRIGGDCNEKGFGQHDVVFSHLSFFDT